MKKKKKRRFILVMLMSVISHCIILLSLALCRFGAISSVPLLLAITPLQLEEDVQELQFDSVFEESSAGGPTVLEAVPSVSLVEAGFGGSRQGAGGNGYFPGTDEIDLLHYRPCVLIIHGDGVKQYLGAIDRCRRWMKWVDQTRLVRIVSGGGKMDKWLMVSEIQRHHFPKYVPISGDELRAICDKEDLYVGMVFSGFPDRSGPNFDGGGPKPPR